MKGTRARLAGSLVAVLGLILLTLSAGGMSVAAQQTSDLPAGMAGVTWQLDSMQIVPPQVAYPLQNNIVMTIQFDGQGNLNGVSACNDYFATYTTGPNQAITIGPIGSTRKACAENLMNLEGDYFATLQQASKYNLFQGHLSLTTAGTGILNYISSTTPTIPGMPTTGNGAESLLVLFALALGLGLVAAGMVVNSRRREFRAVRIRIRK